MLQSTTAVRREVTYPLIIMTLYVQVEEAKSVYLGPLIVTPEIVAKKVKAIKDHKSPGVDGIPPKLLIETI